MKVAESRFTEAESAIGRLEANEKAVGEAQGRVQALEGERKELAEALADTGSRVDAARARVRELESGDAEQRRRLREQELENARMALQQQRTELAARVEKATEIRELGAAVEAGAGAIEDLEAALDEKREVLARAGDANARDEAKIDALRRKRLVARYRAAASSTAALEKERAEALELERQAKEAEKQAGALRDEAASLNAPDEAELGRLRAAEEESRIAAAKLSVGLTAELTVEAAIEATVDADGNVRTLTPEPGTPVELEATRELAVELPGVATLRVRGGGRDLKEQADAAEARWQAASGPVFGRTGCSSLEELVAQRQRAEDLRSQAAELMREAEADALRAEGRNVIEQRLATARAERDKYAADLGEYLEAGQTVDELAATFDDPLDEAALGSEIDSLQAGLHERRSLSEQDGRPRSRATNAHWRASEGD